MTQHPAPPDAGDAKLTVAVRSTRLLGLATALFGLVVVVAFGYFNRYQRYQAWFIGIGLLVWFVPGVLYLTCAGYLARRRRGAAVAGIALASVQAVCAAAAFLANFMLTPISPIPVVLTALWLAALVQLIVQLRRVAEDLGADAQYHRGFEPLPVAVLPVDDGDQSDARARHA
jgi:hypothetical protein